MLYIIRHGLTDWNKRKKLQGRTDILLNEEGRNSARLAAEKYKDVHFDICYCSPLLRAKETADILLEGRNIPIEYDDRLVEMSFGIYEGAEKSFEDANNPVNVIFREPQNYKTPLEGAESFEQLYERTGSFLKEKVYPKVEKGLDVLIVGHGAMNSAIICQVNNIPVKDFWSAGIENCELKKLL